MLGELTCAQIDEVLHAGTIGRIGCISEGRVYVVPIAYVYENGCVYGHSVAGKKLHAMRAEPTVCFEVEQVDSLDTWRSVIAWGTFEALSGDAAQAGMQLLIDRLMPLMPRSAATHEHAAHSAHPAAGATAFRIRLEEKTGRYEAH